MKLSTINTETNERHLYFSDENGDNIDLIDNIDLRSIIKKKPFDETDMVKIIFTNNDDSDEHTVDVIGKEVYYYLDTIKKAPLVCFF